jgi:hypothetical protein
MKKQIPHQDWHHILSHDAHEKETQSFHLIAHGGNGITIH